MGKTLEGLHKSQCAKSGRQWLLQLRSTIAILLYAYVYNKSCRVRISYDYCVTRHYANLYHYSSGLDPKIALVL